MIPQLSPPSNVTTNISSKSFTKWSSWAGLIIRVDKCSTFGIKKVRTYSTQYEPYLKIANERIPSTEMNKSFINLTKTWVAETLDNKFSKFCRRWLQIPVSGNISHIFLPRSKLGFEIKILKQIYNEDKVSNWSILKWSLNAEGQKYYELTSNKNVKHDYNKWYNIRKWTWKTPGKNKVQKYIIKRI